MRGNDYIKSSAFSSLQSSIGKSVHFDTTILSELNRHTDLNTI